MVPTADWTNLYSPAFTTAGFVCDKYECVSTTACSDLYSKMADIVIEIDSNGYTITPEGYTWNIDVPKGSTNLCKVAIAPNDEFK
jgi:CYTH domain-containing protein